MELDRCRAGSRFISLAISFVFTFVFYFTPVRTAVAEEDEKRDRRQGQIDSILDRTPEKKLARRLQQLKEIVVKEITPDVNNRSGPKGLIDQALTLFNEPPSPLTDNETQKLRELRADIKQSYKSVLARFKSEAQGISQHTELSPQAQRLADDRYQAALAQLTSNVDQLETHLDAILSATDQDDQTSALQALADFLAAQRFRTDHSPLDPEQLPWGSPDKTVRKPAENQQAMQQILKRQPTSNYVQVAALDLGGGMLAVADAGGSGAVSSADLAGSLEIDINEDIVALAASLNNNPAEIYAWVHNNIHFLPSYGSIQGAAHTLQLGRGNAMDTASLLIALLRAAGVPARYAYGTVEIPIDEVMNWVGGVTDPEAASSLLGQGKIPHDFVTENGVVTAVLLEHTWVEAYVDFEPSRGLFHQTGDNWIPMDAAFKQYVYEPGMNLQDNVPFDAEGLLTTIEQEATINEAEGWVQGVNESTIDAQLTDFQEQLSLYIESQNPDATVGEVLGLQTITVKPPLPFAAGLPYSYVLTHQTFSEVPDHLRHRFRYTLAADDFGLGSDLIVIDQPTVAIAGKSLALSFSPETEADAEIIASYIPEPDPDTGEIDPALLPDSLPGYLINLTADFSIDGDIVQSQAAGTMGTQLYETMGLYDPEVGWRTVKNQPIAGAYRAIGVDLQGISVGQAETLAADVEATRAVLESGDETQFATLTKHDLVGDLMYGTIMSYFALNGIQSEIQAASSDMVVYRQPGFGVFSTALQPEYLFGIPRETRMAGLFMDVDVFVEQREAKDNNQDTRLGYSIAAGSRSSAMEHLVPEQMFSTAEAPAQSISAVKALALASQEGQRIYTITQDNLDSALDAITLNADMEADIRHAVNTGKVVTTHEMNLIFGDWVGAGYTAIDPETGAGAYVIGNGENGGILIVAAFWVLAAFYLTLFVTTFIAGFLLFPFAAAAIFLTLLSSLYLLVKIREFCSDIEYLAASMALLVYSGFALLLSPILSAISTIVTSLIPESEQC